MRLMLIHIETGMAERYFPRLRYRAIGVGLRFAGATRFSRPVKFMAAAVLARVVASLTIVLLLGVSAAEAGHHDEEDCARNECALCAAGSLAPLAGAHSAPSACPAGGYAAAPGPQGPPLCALYRNCLPSRAPPVPA